MSETVLQAKTPIGAPKYQLDQFDRIQRRAVRIVEDPLICERLDILALRRDVSSLCVLYRIYYIYYGECSEELFDLLPAAEFSNRTVLHNLIYHPHHLDTWQSTAVRFRRNFLPRASELCNGLPAAVFPGRYDMGTFKKRVYLHLKGWQRTCSFPAVARSRGRLDAAVAAVIRTLVCLVLFHKKKESI